MESSNKTLPLLVKEENSSFKLIVTEEVERKIRHLCTNISSVEWSGALFYTSEGSYEENNIVITCKDIFLMDIGSHTYTEFDMSPDVIAYMTSHPELLDCQIGLIHSHCTFQTFFSGTDLNTLREEGNDRNHFVSLIVNNEGTYTAAITRKIEEKQKIKSFYTYNTYNDEVRKGSYEKEVTAETILYTLLSIEKYAIQEDHGELNGRIKEIKDQKAKVSTYNRPELTYQDSFYTGIKDFKQNSFKEASLFDDYIGEFSKYSSNTISESTVKSIVNQLITGSVAVIDSNKIDPNVWVNKMVSVFDKRFKSINDFEIWAEIYIEYVLTSYIPSPTLPGFDENLYVKDLAEAVMKKLEKLPKNKYLAIIIDNLNLWIQY